MTPWFALVESNTTGSGRLFCAAARERGLRPVVLTADPARYPYLAEDHVDVLVCDTGDVEAVFTTCRSLAGEGLAGIASSSEYYATTAARCARELGLPSAPAESIARCRDKAVQRAVLADAGVPVPEFHVVADVPAAVARARAIGFPVVVKPTSGSGSVGVRLCRDEVEVRDHVATLVGDVVNERGLPTSGRALVESYVDGPEFSVETFHGDVVAVVAKHLGPPPHFVEIGHDFPAHDPGDVLAATALGAVRALGLGWGAAHTELRLAATGPVIIEVNPRLAGGMIPAMIDAALGVDLVDSVVAAAAGGPPRPPAGGAGGASIRFVLPTSAGVVRAVRGLDAARAVPGVRAAETTVLPGAVVRPTGSFRDRVGWVIATDTAAADTAVALITVELRRF